MLKTFDSLLKPSLLSLVKDYLNKPTYASHYGGSGGFTDDLYGGGYNDYSSGWDAYDDDIDNMYGDAYTPRSKSVKATRRSVSKKSNISTDKDWKRVQKLLGGISVRDFSDVDDDSDGDDKMIYYYPDASINNDIREFRSLHSFNEFLESEGISISDSEVESLCYRTVSHCSINPMDRAINGSLNLISDHSYGALYYSCCESSE